MNDRRFLLFGIPLLALLELVPRGLFQLTSVLYAVAAYGISLTFTVAIWLGVRGWWARLLRWWPTPASTARRLWWLGAGSVAYTLLVTVVLGAALARLYGGQLSPGQALRETGLNLVSSLIVLLIYEARHTFGQWEVNLRRADQLAQAQTQAQLDALTQQLDPHFLFNSLNTLAALIDPADVAAQAYVEGLADLYRYVLLSRERPTVPLADELALVRTYVALQQVRFRDKVQVTYDLDPAALAQRVAPLSVQALLENALKHNEASEARPLHIWVRAAAGALRVENTYQPRPSGLAPGLGTGLANVRQRYALLGAARPVEAGPAGGLFVVALPLLPA
jgi:sensor histidine kinase YesM